MGLASPVLWLPSPEDSAKMWGLSLCMVRGALKPLILLRCWMLSFLPKPGSWHGYWEWTGTRDGFN